MKRAIEAISSNMGTPPGPILRLSLGEGERYRPPGQSGTLVGRWSRPLLVQYRRLGDGALPGVAAKTSTYRGLLHFSGNGVFLPRGFITLRLRDETLAARQASGITVKTSFDVKPGSYVIRLVARDAEGHMMSAENGSVEIP